MRDTIVRDNNVKEALSRLDDRKRANLLYQLTRYVSEDVKGIEKDREKSKETDFKKSLNDEIIELTQMLQVGIKKNTTTAERSKYLSEFLRKIDLKDGYEWLYAREYTYKRLEYMLV